MISQGTRERRARFGVRVAALVLSILAADLVVASAYLWKTGAPCWQAYKQKEEAFRTSSDRYHHELRKSVTVRRLSWGPYHYTIHTNSLGFKDRTTRVVPLAVSGPRILFMGDSFTEGVGMPYEKTFVGLIDAALRPKNTDVLNAAAVSYSPLIYWKKTAALMDEGLQFDEEVVFIDISDAIDEGLFYAESSDGRVLRAEAVHVGTAGAPLGTRAWQWVRDHSIIIPGVVTAGQYVAGKDRYAVGQPRAQWTFDEGRYAAYGRRGVERMQEHMDRLWALLQSRGIGLTVAVYPWPDQVMYDVPDNRQARIWREWCGARGVRFIDLNPLFMKPGAEMEERRRVLDDDYIPRDVHWNERGHRLVAGAFLQAWTPATR